MSASDPARSLRRVAMIGSPDKRDAATELMARLRMWGEQRAQIVFAETTYESSKSMAHKPDLLFVLGGDGTLIAAVHDLGMKQIPIVGVNLGKLGFLADFTVEQLESDGTFLFEDPLPVTRRVMLSADIHFSDGRLFHAPVVNDCVIQAGPPFRMVEINVRADGHDVAQIAGDGLIIATPTGSTAHNLAAGGPILEPTAESVILTPICPHALTYRPLTMAAERRIEVQVLRSNEGTTAVIDGRTSRPFQRGDRLTITRYAADFLLVRNPRHAEWDVLRQKLKWAQSPTLHR